MLKKILSTLVIISIFSVTIHAKREKIDFSMVISGGVSLGAYEAGYNWAMIKMLSKIKKHDNLAEPELRSVAGA